MFFCGESTQYGLEASRWSVDDGLKLTCYIISFTHAWRLSYHQSLFVVIILLIRDFVFNKDDSNENRVVDVVLFLNLRCNPSWKVYLRVCVPSYSSLHLWRSCYLLRGSFPGKGCMTFPLRSLIMAEPPHRRLHVPTCPCQRIPLPSRKRRRGL